MNHDRTVNHAKLSMVNTPTQTRHNKCEYLSHLFARIPIISRKDIANMRYAMQSYYVASMKI